MQLPAFIQRMLGFADRVEANLKAAEDLAAARARIGELEGELKTEALANQADKNHVAALISERDKLVAETVTKDGEITTLKAEVATAKNSAQAVIAAQGVPADLLPTQSADSGTTATHSVQAQVDQLRKKIAASTDPKEKFTLSQEIKELLSKAKQ